MLNVLRVASAHPPPWEGCDIPCFPWAAHQPCRLQPCQAPAGSVGFEMPKPFLRCLLQTDEGDLPLPGPSMAALGSAAIPAGAQEGCHGTAAL